MRRMEQTNSSPEQPVFNPDDTVVFKRSHFYTIMVVFAFAAGILTGYMAWGRTPAAQPAAAVPAGDANPQAADAAVTRYDIPTDGYPSMGPDDAEIVIVEFSDYQCPYCKRWHDQVLDPLLAKYPGQIQLVYRNLPLTSIHSDALPSAVAAMCAGDQGAYWPFHNKLFSDQYGLDRDAFVQYAEDLELDLEAFETCLDSGSYDDFIQEDLDFAVNMGVRSTPTFFINGLAVVGAQPLDTFSRIIDQELAGEIE